MSRPEKKIDWKKVDQLLLSGCHGTEIAPHFDMDVETFYRKVQKEKNIGFTGYSALKKQQGDSLLKNKQFEKAMSGDNVMLIWLGKTRLKQREIDAQFIPNDDKLDELIKSVKSKKDSTDAPQPETAGQLQPSDEAV